MTRPNKNTLPPASLATDGEQGESATTRGGYGVEHTPHDTDALFLAAQALAMACQYLQQYGTHTDCPAPNTVEAADHLDAAASLLAEVAQ